MLSQIEDREDEGLYVYEYGDLEYIKHLREQVRKGVMSLEEAIALRNSYIKPPNIIHQKD